MRPGNIGETGGPHVAMMLLACALAIVMPEKEQPGWASSPPAPLNSPGTPEQLTLGPFFCAKGPIHKMTRAELASELSQRNTPYRVTDSDDLLRIRVHDARAALLGLRNERIMQAERVMQEVSVRSSAAFISDNSLDTVLADDNAVFAASLGQHLIRIMNLQAMVGAAVGLALWRFKPLGKIELHHRLLPAPFTFSASGYLAVSLTTSALLGLLQAVTQHLRRVFNAESFFGQKLAAVACREGVIEWMMEVDNAGANPSIQAPKPQLFRPSTILPILSMAAGR